MKLSSIAGAAITTLIISLACVLPAHAELQARDIGHTGATNAFYDTTLDVTWLDVASGALTWTNANAWASSLNVSGVTGWRLPAVTYPLTAGNESYNGTNMGYNVATSSSEMASLFFDTLGNKSSYNTSGVAQPGYGLTNTGGFQNLQTYVYWLGTEYAPNTVYAWYFGTDAGVQRAYDKNDQLYALAVHPGDVAPVPEPETYAMLLAGLGLIGAISRRRTAKPTV